jgi:hypothetical protein
MCMIVDCWEGDALQHQATLPNALHWMKGAVTNQMRPVRAPGAALSTVQNSIAMHRLTAATSHAHVAGAVGSHAPEGAPNGEDAAVDVPKGVLTAGTANPPAQRTKGRQRGLCVGVPHDPNPIPSHMQPICTLPALPWGAGTAPPLFTPAW